MPITDINVWTHPITDTDIQYEGQHGSRSTSYAVLPPTSPILRNWLVALACGLPAFTCGLNGRQYTMLVYGSKRRGGVGRHCPQALGQTVVITSKQALGAKQAGRGRGRCMQASLGEFHQITITTILWPILRDHPGKPVPKENFWTLWCKGRLTEADTPTSRLDASPSGLSSFHLDHPPCFYRLDALPAAQPTVSKH